MDEQPRTTRFWVPVTATYYVPVVVEHVGSISVSGEACGVPACDVAEAHDVARQICDSLQPDSDVFTAYAYAVTKAAQWLRENPGNKAEVSYFGGVVPADEVTEDE